MPSAGARPIQGRYWLLLWLAVFLGVAAAVVTRQASALGVAKRLARLREARAALEARRAELERRVRLAASREVLGRRAETGLGLHVAADTELVLLPVAPPAGPER